MDGPLAENLERKKLDEIQVSEIDAILPSLLEQNLITEMECRFIAGYNQLLEKQGAVHKVIISKTKDEVAHLAEIFRKLTCHVEELSKKSKTYDCEEEQEYNLPQDKPNPLLTNTVLACLFGYLPLDDIKHSRLVCRKWNSVAEICLRKRCTIHFHPDGLTPQSFMELSKYSLPDLPFPAYKFSGVDYAWCEDHIENFFDKWGKNIKEVELVPAGAYHDRIYDVTPLIAKTSSLCSLKIRWLGDNALFSVSIDKLATIKTVFLQDCRILTNGEPVTFLPLSNVSLIDVSFERPTGNIEAFHDYDCFYYNEFFDFSHTVNLTISSQFRGGIKFDMEGQINKNQLNLCFVVVINWTKAKGEVNFLRLSGCDFTERNDLKITRMVIDNSEVNLSALPQTLEQLIFGDEVDIVSTEPYQLPNLKYLGFEAESDNSRMLSHFANCPNLTNLELFGKDEETIVLTLDLDWIPRSVKKLRIDGSLKFDFANVDQVLELDTLILESIDDYSNCKKLVENIKPKILVVVYEKLRMPLNPFDIVEIILANKEIGTIVVGTVEEDVDLYEKIPFEGSTFSSYVDRKSNYYKFENQVGHAIERKEYEEFSAIADMGYDYFANLSY